MVKIKILVGYHKPAKLYKSDIYVPIHLGRALATEASKDGKMSQDDYQWLVDNMIGDDTGDNISELNRHFCELTGIYWAWKNYDKLGNPEYIGFMHYRRPFLSDIIDEAQNWDIVGCHSRFGWPLKHQLIQNHGEESCQQFLSLLPSEDVHDLEKYLSAKDGYFYNMFIMKKDIFFGYCAWLFDILLRLHKNLDYSKLSYCNKRMVGYMAERLTGMFIFRHEKKCKVKKYDVAMRDEGCALPISPLKDDSVNICLSADDNYAPYLAVTIQSIKENADSDFYDICVIDDGISAQNKKRILSLVDDTFSIRFIDIKPYLANVSRDVFVTNAHFTQASYFRLFIPQIFAKYAKILYLDCDLVVHHNLKELFAQDLGGKAVGAVLDIEMYRQYFIKLGTIPDYLQNTLKMKSPKKYFQSGVLLLDIQKLRQMDFVAKALQRLQEIGNPRFVDQCVLNSLFDGDVCFLEPKWNVEWHIPYYIQFLDRQLPEDMYFAYMNSRKNPYIVHYCGGVKPWKDKEVDLADIWWKYARLTPFYEDFLFALFKQKSSMNESTFKLHLKYWYVKFIYKISWGEKHRKYKLKKNKLKEKLSRLRKRKD